MTVVVELNQDYEVVREYLAKHKSVDMITVGGSPATFRWLTSKNKYINLGLEQKEKSSFLKTNDNSYGVTQEELDEAAKDICDYFSKKS